MKKMLTFLFSVMLLTFGATLAFAGPPDFSGTWVMDKKRSNLNQNGGFKTEGLPPEAIARTKLMIASLEFTTMVITQKNDQLTMDVDPTVKNFDMPANRFTYDLTGKETSMQITGQRTGTALLKAQWLEKAQTLELHRTSTFRTNVGTTRVAIVTRMQLTDRGHTVRLKRVIHAARGDLVSDLVFVKK